MYADNKELWAGIIKDLYDKVELFLSKHNSEQFFKAFPQRRKPFVFEKNYLLKWRVKKTIKLLTDKYGGKLQLRVMLFILLVTIVIFLLEIIFKITGTMNVIDWMITQASNLWVLASSIMGSVVAVVSSIRLIYFTLVNIETSRGDAIVDEAASLKDSLGFLQRVGIIINFY